MKNKAFDDTAKTRYRDYFQQRGLRAIPQYEVFSRSRATDLFVECNEKERQALDGTVFDYFRLINAIEFKGNNDPLTTSDFNLIMMRAWGIGVVDKTPKSEKERKPSPFLHIEEIADLPTQRTVTIICVQRPRKVLNTLKNEFKFQTTDEPGIYCDYAQKVPARIIHPTELPLEPKYYPLLPLARGKKLEQFIELCFNEGLVDYLQLTLDLGVVTDPDVIWRKLKEAYGMQTQLREDTWPYIDDFFRNVPEAMYKLPSMQEVFKAKQEAEERILIVEEQIKQAKVRAREEAERVRIAEERAHREAERARREAERARQEEERARQEAERARQEEERVISEKQQFLARFLQHQFGDLPDDIAQLIERNRDRTELDQWLDQAFTVRSFAEINFLTQHDESNDDDMEST